MQLYTTSWSANCVKVHAVASFLGVNLQMERVNVYEGEGQRTEFLEINPQGTVPVLRDGDLVLSESNAIIQYLARQSPKQGLWPSDAKAHAQMNRWMFWEAARWQPAVGKMLGPYVAMRLGISDAFNVEVDWLDGDFAGVAGTLEDHLSQHAFLGGQQIGLADFSVAAMLMYTHDLTFPADRFPYVAQWYANISGRWAWWAALRDSPFALFVEPANDAVTLPDADQSAFDDVWPELLVRDLGASVSHYRDRLGFERFADGEPEQEGAVRMERQGLRVRLRHAESPSPSGFSARVRRTHLLSQLRQEWEARGASVEPAPACGGDSLTVRDLDGNQLRLYPPTGT